MSPPTNIFIYIYIRIYINVVYFDFEQFCILILFYIILFSGALFSNIYLIEAICALGGSTLFNNIYQQTVTIYKGMVFFIMAAFSFSALMLMM